MGEAATDAISIKKEPLAATLYIGDLDPSVSESDLRSVFAGFGSIHYVRDHATGASLRYAYLNFNSQSDAKNAISVKNHEILKGKPMRIMWSTRDSNSRKDSAGNLFVKNLGEGINGSELEGWFGAFGTVVSCKVATDEKGKSRGFGFVQMDSEEAAKSAMEGLNGKDVQGANKKLYVTKFVKKSLRRGPPDHQNCTNLYIKNLERDITDDFLREKFSEFGGVCSAVVMKNDLGGSKGFGFVSFKLPEQAKKAMEAMNGSTFGTRTVYVGLAQKKSEREELLKLHFGDKHEQQLKNVQRSNVYVKFLHDSVDDKALREYFLRCGKVVSTKVMQRDGMSRGFGFVCFSSPDQANRAVARLDGTVFHGKRLYVAIAQRREDRRKAMQLLHFPKNNMGSPRPLSYSCPSTHYLQHYEQPRNYIPFQYQGYQALRYASPIYQQGQLAYANGSQVNNTSLLKAPSQYTPFLSQLHHPVPVHTAHPPLKVVYPVQPTRYGESSDIYKLQKVRRPITIRAPQKSVNGLKNVYATGFSDDQLKKVDVISPSGDPEKQKQLMGEKLYLKVQDLELEHASKITGMLLEMSHTELKKVMQSPELLAERVKEAVEVLEDAKVETATATDVQPSNAVSTTAN